MEERIDGFTDSELARVSLKIIPDHNLTINGENLNINWYVEDLFNKNPAIANEARRILQQCLYVIADKIEYEKQNEDLRDEPTP